jgi:hypothetical protein
VRTKLPKLSWLLVLVCLIFTTACSDASGSSSESNCVSPAPLHRDLELPPELPLTDELTLTRARVQKESAVVEGFQETSVKQAYKQLRKSVTAHGYKTVTFDFEGFEAEIFFSDKSISAGALRLREGPCNGQVTVTLLFDPIDTAAGKRILNEARTRFDH